MPKKKKFKVVFTGGGSGGHSIPIIAVCREMKKILGEENVIFYYLGPADPLTKVLLPDEGIKIKGILSGKLRRYINLKSVILNFVDLFKIPLGFLQSFLYLFFIYPNLIFSKGGFGSLGPNLAGWLLGIPLFLHESDSVAGLSNRICGFFAKKVFLSFKQTLHFSQKKIIFTGNPIRKELLEGKREEAIEYFKITKEKPVILILGGSQGAQRINEKVLAILNKLLEDFEVIHQCGFLNFKKMKTITKVLIKEELKKYYHLFPFLKEEELKKAYAICDLVISRAGAGTIFEIAALGKPSILIPLPESAQNHQLKNAYIFASAGAAILIEERNLTPDFFLGTIKNLFSNPKKMEEMRKAALKFAKPEAAKEIAQYLVSYLTKEKSF